jgi:TorA maturation chaperone TorD
MVTKLAEVKQERNTALLKVIEKDGTIGRLSEQLQSECQALVPSSPLLRAHHDFSSLFIFQRLRPSWSNLGCSGSRTQPP